jgi:hypothetical protein
VQHEVSEKSTVTGVGMQIFAEIEDRSRFLEGVLGTKVSADSLQGVKMEIVQRLNELEHLGVPTDQGRRLPARAERKADPNFITR